ncbi:RNase H family protein [Vibrio fluvialis]|uniref:RNase H family protein n=1 Tax=Vibrio fluvialis TaxID=676 RepID=UPI00155852F3|nr:RNase H family protein [Vibrio fluvialis]
MSKRIYVEAALIERQRGGPCGGTGLVVLDDHLCIANEESHRIEGNTDLMRLDLLALIHGLKYASDGDVIKLSSEYCFNGFHEWLDGWKRRGWRKANKKPIANGELWQLVDRLRAEKFVEVEKADFCAAAKVAAYKLAYSAASR